MYSLLEITYKVRCLRYSVGANEGDNVQFLMEDN
jgi:hypothetical protein